MKAFFVGTPSTALLAGSSWWTILLVVVAHAAMASGSLNEEEMRSNSSGPSSLLRPRRRQTSTSLEQQSVITCQLHRYEALHLTGDSSQFHMCRLALADDDNKDEMRISQLEYKLQPEPPASLLEKLHSYYYHDPKGDDTDQQILDFSLRVPQTTARPWIEISHATLDQTEFEVRVPDWDAVRIVPPDDQRRRRLQQQQQHAASADGRRNLLASKGAHTLLPILIRTADGAEPIYEESELFDLLFVGAGSVKRQFYDCSFGQLSVEPTALAAITVQINERVSDWDNNPQRFGNSAVTGALAQINRHLRQQNKSPVTSLHEYADMIMFVTPDLPEWLALAEVGGARSYFNDHWGGYLGVLAHEFAHNFGLLHANERGEYQDYSNYMGASIWGYHTRKRFPLMSYNAYHHYQLGWFDERRVQTISSTTNAPAYQHHVIRVIAFVDYDLVRDDMDDDSSVVIVEILDGHNLYLQYNRAKKHNAHPYEYADHLTIVQNRRQGTELVAALSEAAGVTTYTSSRRNSSFESRNMVQTVRIELCSEHRVSRSNAPDYMMVSITTTNSGAKAALGAGASQSFHSTCPGASNNYSGGGGSYSNDENPYFYPEKKDVPFDETTTRLSDEMLGGAPRGGLNRR